MKSHCTLLQLPKKLLRFSCLCSLQKIRLPRPLGACLCYLLPQRCSICGNGLILFKTFQRIEVALAGAEAHCRIERILQPLIPTQFCPFFFWLVAAWVKSRAERPSVSGVNRQLHVQIGCKLGIRNRKDELTKQAKRNELQINPKVIKGVNACRKRSFCISFSHTLSAAPLMHTSHRWPCTILTSIATPFPVQIKKEDTLAEYHGTRSS